MTIPRPSVLSHLQTGELQLDRRNTTDRGRLVRTAEGRPGRRDLPFTQGRRVLAIEPDDDAFRNSLAFLGQHGFRVSRATDALQARKALADQRFDLVILDLNLPDEDGLVFCREIAADAVARLLVHSCRSNPLDHVTALEFGADDFVDKGCHVAEILARVRALMRRPATRSPFTASASSPYIFNDWQFDPGTGALAAPGSGSSTWLSAADASLLTVLLRRPGELLSRRQMEDELFGPESKLSPRAIDVRIVRLRRALESCLLGGGRLVRTLRDGGYLLDVLVTRDPDQT